MWLLPRRGGKHGAAILEALPTSANASVEK